jgi:DNA polymerase III epsilon subunit family exonuclease
MWSEGVAPAATGEGWEKSVRPYPVRVALDLETTGLHAEQDAVMEIGAVKFAGAETVDTFEALVAPGIPIPYRIQRLTGITPARVRGAPPLAEVVPALRAFLGDLPLVGHSVPFDAAFLRRAGVARRNPLIDTYELASALLPDIPSYSLAAVGAALGLSSPTYHRALADAELSRDVFLALMERLDGLDAAALEALGRLAAPDDWTPSYLIRHAVRRQRGETQPASPFASLLGASIGTSLGDKLAATLGMDPAVLSLAIVRDSRPLLTLPPPDALPPTAATEEGAPLARVIAAQVRGCLDDGGVLALEVQNRDEGVIACLAPALAWAAQNSQNGQRLLISCADAESASRLIRSVLPHACRAAAIAAEDIPLALVAAPDDYLCLHRWFGAARTSVDGPLARDTVRGLAKLTVWSARTETGLRAEVSLSGQEVLAWERTRAGVEFADSRPDCVYRRDGYCFAARAQDAAVDARVVVTTHAALAAHLAGRETLLPPAARVVILDTHLLGDALREAGGAALDRQALLTALATLAHTQGAGQRTGLFHAVAERLDAKQAQARERTWFAQVERTRQGVAAFFQALRAILNEAQGEPAGGALGDAPEHRTLRLDGRTQQLQAWKGASQAWAALDERLAALSRHAREAAQLAVAQRGAGAGLASDGVAADLAAYAHTFDTLREAGARMLSGANDNAVSWLRVPYTQPNGFGSPPPSRTERHGKQRRQTHPPQPATASAPEPPLALESPVLHTAPIRVGPLLEPLWVPGRALALAAPALSVGGDFAYVRGSLGLPDDLRTLTPSMDCADQTLICLPTDVPEPNAPQYQRRLDETLTQLAAALAGNVVAIFPSHAALRASAVSIRRALERHDILVLAQGQDGSARQLWHTFRNEPRVVLLGAGAFWEGAGQPEHPPACVVVTRVPFPALSDPLLAARAETWSDPQSQFVVPHAALRLRQALGGLAWSHQRRNAVVLFDRRLQTRGYGQTILSTLPRCTQQQDTVSQIVERVTDWLATPATAGS